MARAARPTRRLTLADLGILVGATAFGLVLLRWYLAGIPAGMFWPVAARTVEVTYGAWSTTAACWMIALLVIEHSGPHPRRARLVRRPGYVACCVGVLALGWGGIVEWAGHGVPGLAAMPTSFQQVWVRVSPRVGSMVAGAWLVLALSGRWRADPGAIDRLGRLLGGLWIGWLLFWLLPQPIRGKIPPFWDGVLT